MNSWKWTKGEPYQKSKRIIKNENLKEEEDNISTIEFEKSAYSSSLNHDENTWDILNKSIYNDFKQSNKREDLDSKIADRELVQQIGVNPFLNQTNYIDDISTRDMFLKPINTTQEKEKKENK
jgi:hypothetical protein